MRAFGATLLSMFGVLLLLSTACNTQRLAPVEEVPVASITVSPSALSIAIGARVAVLAIPLGTNGNTLGDRSVAWSSSNPAIAAVSQTGSASAEVLGMAVGTASITAITGNKASSVAVTVTQQSIVPVDTVVIAPMSASVDAGQTVQLTAVAKDASGNVLAGRTISWSSSNTSIATVSASGVITGVAQGIAGITAASEGLQTTATITVMTPPPTPVASVGVAPAPASVVVGQTVQLTATPRSASGTPLIGRVVTWTSSNVTVATVSSAGLVTGISIGSATIAATSEGKTGTASVTVTSAPATPVARVDITPATAGVVTGQTIQLTATPKDAGGNPLTGRTVTWASSNTALATVSSTGLVTGVAPGSVTITATSEQRSGTGTVTVTLPPVATVEVAPAAVGMIAGQTIQLTATPKDGSGMPLAGRTVTWASSNTGIATVSSSGLVSGVSPGTVTITATSEGKSGTATVTTTVAPVATVTVAPFSATVVAGQTVQLTATLKDASGNMLTGRSVAWASSNTAVMSVSSTGLVTGVSAGSATIIATSEGQTGTASITVSSPPPPPVASVSVSPSSASIVVGQTTQLTATLKDASGTTLTGRAVTWSTSNPTAATVSSSGLVTGMAAGSATIIATSEGVQGSAAISVSAAATAPSAVTNLSVVGATDNSVTLSFTEVADGAGLPASYDVRFAVSPLSWGSATKVTQGTCRVPLLGTAIGALRTCTVLGLAASTSYQFQVVAFRGTLDVNAVYGALSNVASGSTTASTAPVATVIVTPASASIGVGATQQLTAVLKDASGNTLTGRPVSWVSANTAVATVSSAGLVTGVAAGSVTITATSEGRSGTANVTVTTSTAPGGWPNEPAGLATLTDNPWNTLTHTGWDSYDPDTPNLRLVSDAGAPRSPTNVAEFFYPRGWVAGSAGALSWYYLTGDELFIGVYFKYSLNWQQPDAGLSKMFYFFQRLGADRQASFMTLAGATGGTLTLQICNEAGGGEWWKQNVSNVQIVPGRWYRLELYLKRASATGAADGIVRWWLDGTLVANHPAARLRGERFSEFHLAPVWGGLGGVKAHDDYLRFDHIYLSRR